MIFLFLDPLLLIWKLSYSILKIGQYLLSLATGASVAEMPTNIDQSLNGPNSASRGAREDPKKRKIIRI